jgi:putative hydrolase of the HAD superfamily
MPQLVKPRAILFDFYNTLLEIRTDEHDPAVWVTLARFLRYQGLPVEAGPLQEGFTTRVRAALKESQEAYPEINLLHIFQSLLAGVGFTGPAEFTLQVTWLFRALTMRHFSLFPDTLPALRRLRGSFKLGIISDAQRLFLEPEMKQCSLFDLFDVRIISSDHGFRKPDPRLFVMALAGLGQSSAEAIYVGDDLFHDMCGARAAGMPGVLLKRHSRRHRTRPQCQPDRSFDSLDELANWLLG